MFKRAAFEVADSDRRQRGIKNDLLTIVEYQPATHGWRTRAMELTFLSGFVTVFLIVVSLYSTLINLADKCTDQQERQNN